MGAETVGLLGPRDDWFLTYNFLISRVTTTIFDLYCLHLRLHDEQSFSQHYLRCILKSGRTSHTSLKRMTATCEIEDRHIQAKVRSTYSFGSICIQGVGRFQDTLYVLFPSCCVNLNTPSLIISILHRLNVRQLPAFHPGLRNMQAYFRLDPWHSDCIYRSRFRICTGFRGIWELRSSVLLSDGMLQTLCCNTDLTASLSVLWMGRNEPVALERKGIETPPLEVFVNSGDEEFKDMPAPDEMMVFR